MVTDLPSALSAITTIVEQGEGAAPVNDEVPMNPADPSFGFEELSHFAKFERIVKGVDVIGRVWPVPTNPRRSDLDGPVAALAELFDAAYFYVLCMIDAIYCSTNKNSGPRRAECAPWPRAHVYCRHGRVLYPIADLLVRQPGSGGLNAAPRFGYYLFDETTPKTTAHRIVRRRARGLSSTRR